MTKVKLEILGLEFNPGLFKRVYDDGYVNSIIQHQKALDGKYNVSKSYPKQEDKSSFNNAIGMCLTRGKFRKNTHIFYKKSDFKSHDIQVRAHEETHALHATGKLHLLSEKLFDEQRVDINFNNIPDYIESLNLHPEDKKLINKNKVVSEVIAQIGLIYVMVDRNLPFKLVKVPFTKEYEVYFKIACRIYNESKTKSMFRKSELVESRKRRINALLNI